MALSMTGFGASRAEMGDRVIVVETRSVNHRYCDVRVHLPSDLAGMQNAIEKTVRGRIGRGRVDVSIQVDHRADAVIRPRLDIGRARGYAEAFAALGKALDRDDRVPIAKILDAPGVLRSPTMDEGVEVESLLPLVDSALSDLLTMRAEEGGSLASDLQGHLSAIRSLAAAVGARIGPAIAERRARLEQRLDELLADRATLDPQRLAQEVAIIADRVDVTEELERLDSHCNQFSGLLSKDEPVGRKLDFLTQEMNREANTIGSKCADAALAHLVVDLKAELERMREQVQNVE